MDFSSSSLGLSYLFRGAVSSAACSLEGSRDFFVCHSESSRELHGRASRRGGDGWKNLKTLDDGHYSVLLGDFPTGNQGLDMFWQVKTLQWTLANMSNVSWPADACCQLFYNTPGFAKLPSDIDIPQEVPGGLTVEMEVPVLLPEQSGHFKAMWAIFSPSVPTFGEILIAEFEVSDFPFMEWMLVADEVESFASSETQSETQSSPTPCSPRPISAEHLMHQHIFVGNQEVVYPEEMERNGFVSLGKISGAGSWILQMILRNDGTMAWEDCALTCCFGSGFGCSRLGNVEAEPGEAVQLCVELTVETPGTSAWVLSFGGMCFGPVFIAEVV